MGSILKRQTPRHYDGPCLEDDERRQEGAVQERAEDLFHICVDG